MLSLVHSCSAGGLPLGVDYVIRPAAGVGAKDRKRKKPSLMSAALELWSQPFAAINGVLCKYMQKF